jgi:hypothetical protein
MICWQTGKRPVAGSPRNDAAQAARSAAIHHQPHRAGKADSQALHHARGVQKNSEIRFAETACSLGCAFSIPRL